MDRAIVVGLDMGLYDMKASLNELSNLAEAVSIKVVDQFSQKASLPNGKTYIGSGKVIELKQAIDVLDIKIVIFDDVLSPAQIRNLEKALEVQIMDRSFLILSIFAERAQTKEAVLEVSLAQQRYILPRLAGMSSSLSRQGGGSFNAKGAGETKLELDRRKIEQNISRLEKELQKIQFEKETSRKRRSENDIPVVALVGYTNVGKSATLNTLLRKTATDKEKNVFEKNMLFATLQTHTRRIKQEKRPPFVLSDTVGFVTRLPHELVRSFESTLSEVKHADLILHIMDGSSSLKDMQEETTLAVLESLGANQINSLKVYTKKDLMLGEQHDHPADVVISNKTLENIDRLIELIYINVYGAKKTVNLFIPYSDQSVISTLEAQTDILEKQYDENGTTLRVTLYEKQITPYSKYIKALKNKNQLAA